MSISTKATLKPTAVHKPADAPDHLRRNFRLGVISGVGFNLNAAVLSTGLVMTWFLSELTDSNLLISLLIPIELGSWYFLQFILSGHVQRQSRGMPLYRLMAVIRLAATALLFLGTLVLGGSTALLVVFLVAFTANSVAAGVAALPFLNVVAKTIPPKRRGMYFGWRRFLGGALGLVGGVLVKFVLSPDSGLAFPDNYALLFLMGFFFTGVLVGSFSLVVEPEERVDTERVSLSKQLRRAVHLPARDRNYRGYLLVRVALVATSFVVPFYTVYARRELNAPEDMVGIYLICSTAAAVVTNLFLGRLSDRRGNRLLMRLAALTAVLPASLAIIVASMPSATLDKSVMFALVFVLVGLHTTASGIGGINFVLELAPSVDRALYVGFANGIIGLALFASPLAGAFVDWLGYIALFLFALGCGLCAVLFSLRLEEPRELALGSSEETTSAKFHPAAQ